MIWVNLEKRFNEISVVFCKKKNICKIRFIGGKLDLLLVFARRDCSFKLRFSHFFLVKIPFIFIQVNLRRRGGGDF